MFALGLIQHVWRAGVAGRSVAGRRWKNAKQSVISPSYHPKENCQTSAAFYIIKLEAGHGRGEDDALMEAGDRPYETLTFMG